MLKNRNKASYVNGGERRKRRTAGFTMAEMLIVIAIIGVLAAVSFIAVQAHQKSMTQLEYDAIAKEIFVAAQNHLTLAKSENYGQVSDLNTNTALNLKVGDKYFFGPDGNATADTVDDIRYFISSTDNSSTALDQILPFGAVELVTGGNYIIRYQPNAARVLDVFYWTDDKKYGIGSIDYTTAVNDYAGEGKKDERKKIGGNGVLGWCGGEGIVKTGEYLEAPEIEVINADMLLVRVTDKNTSEAKKALTPQLKLIVEGDISGAKVAILLDSTKATYIKNGDRVEYKEGTFTVVLDDITTSGLHFSELQTKKLEGTLDNGKDFVPGENITIQAVAFSNTVLTSVAYSGEWKTNSLFGEVEENVVTVSGKTTKTAETIHVSNIRHLANLNDSLSSVAYSNAYFNSAVSARQTVDLAWDAFKTNINELKGIDANTAIRIFDKNEAATKDDCFLPVTTTYTLNYNGQSDVEIKETSGTGESATTTKTFTENHSIKGIKVDNVDATGNDYAEILNGGVFGSLTAGEIKNLELIDTKVSLASGNAGALAGTLSGGKVENVVAYNSTNATTANVTASAGNAGGLVGSMSAGTEVSKSAAALIVNATGGNAGGLVGSVGTGTACTVSGCYAGGHTIDDPKGSGAVIYSDEKFNVTATAGYAGGLIGDAGIAAISNSYSTCSTAGKYAGGFVGKGDRGGSATNCYATGLVLGGDTTTKTITGEDGKPTTETTFTEIQAQEGAFAYSFGGTATNCKFFEIVNEREEKEATGALTGGYTYLLPVPNDTTGVIKALDENAEEYNNFCGAPTEWKPAEPYTGQTKLESYYAGKYNLKSVEQLAGTLKADDDDTTDYFVATHYGDWPAPEIFVVNTPNS